MTAIVLKRFMFVSISPSSAANLVRVALEVKWYKPAKRGETMRRLGAVLVALVVLNGVLLLAGLGRGRSAGSGKRIKVGLVFDVGGLGDKSFNDGAHRGLMRAAAELDIEHRYVEPGDGSDRESALRQLAAARYDLVIGVGFIFTDDMRKLAERFPEVKFACIDYSVIPGQPPPPPNLVGLKFREQEGSFLVGALAGLVTRTKKVGFVGGMHIPLIVKFEKGYAAGVKHVCPECHVYVAYAGTEPKAFADPTTGKELALAQYARGADVIYHASGKTGAGVFTAAREKGRLAIGVDSDQFDEAPCCVLTSMVKGVDVTVFETIRAVVEGRFEGGLREFGLAEGGVDYVYDDRNRRWIPDDVRRRVEELRREIVDGKIQVPFE
jgi:basic membrane protein A